MRSFWSGSIAFGLVNIPVRLFVATEDKGLDLDMLHKKDLSPIRFARMCKVEEKEVPYEELTRGFEVEHDDYVVLSEEELKKANVQKSRTIEIKQFIKESDIDSIYFEKPYYLEPGKGAEKSYALLYEALLQSKKVGVATFILRTKENLAIIKPYKNTLLLNQIRFHHSIRDTKDLNIPDTQTVTKREISMALAYIGQLTEKFKPGEFKDTYKEEVKKLIEAKSKGQKIHAKGKVIPPTKVDDLMNLLKANLEQARINPN